MKLENTLKYGIPCNVRNGVSKGWFFGEQQYADVSVKIYELLVPGVAQNRIRVKQIGNKIGIKIRKNEIFAYNEQFPLELCEYVLSGEQEEFITVEKNWKIKEVKLKDGVLSIFTFKDIPEDKKIHFFDINK